MLFPRLQFVGASRLPRHVVRKKNKTMIMSVSTGTSINWRKLLTSPAAATATATAAAAQKRNLSSGGWNQRGYDLTYESLNFGNRPKCILQGYGPSGFDVFNVVKKIDPNEASDGTMHMHGSILAFPHGCFLWNVETARDVTLESLAPIFLHQPPIEMLFIGCDTGTIPSTELNRIRLALQDRNIVLEKRRVADCIGHFNILNAEDRTVATALVINPDESTY